MTDLSTYQENMCLDQMNNEETNFENETKNPMDNNSEVPIVISKLETPDCGDSDLLAGTSSSPSTSKIVNVQNIINVKDGLEIVESDVISVEPVDLSEKRIEGGSLEPEVEKRDEENEFCEKKEGQSINDMGDEILDTNKTSEMKEVSMEDMGVDIDQGFCYPTLEYKFENACQITGAWKEFKQKSDICMRGCKWAPDGTCILANNDDNILRVFDLPRELHCQERWQKGRTLPEIEPALRVVEGGLVYDYCWYPLMSSWNPLSCCFVSTSKDSPIHLWDAFNGKLRCSYRAYNAVDEVEAAYSLAFNPSGEKLYCGFKNVIRVFNTNLPGRECVSRNLKQTLIPSSRQTGIVSCICVNPAMPDIYAAGSYSKSVGLYTEPHGTLLCLLLGQSGGVTQIQFSSDGTKLFSGGRKDPEIICWDIRNPGNVLFTVKRKVETNQRIYFDITSDSNYFVSGNTNGIVSIWDTTQISNSSGEEPVLSSFANISAHSDCVNGVSIHQQYPILATTSGQRHIVCSEIDPDSDSPDNNYEDTGLKLWWVGNTTSEP